MTTTTTLLRIIRVATHLLRHDQYTILVMALKGNVEKKAFVDLRVHQDMKEKLGVQDHQDLKDQQGIGVQMVFMEELVLMVYQDQKAIEDYVDYLEILVLLALPGHLVVSVTI